MIFDVNIAESWLKQAPVTMETNNLIDYIGFDDDFRECSSENCRNDCLKEKTTCKHCTENITLKDNNVKNKDLYNALNIINMHLTKNN